MPPLRLGIAGLGAVSRRILASVERLPDVTMQAGADIDADAVRNFQARRGGRGFGSVEAMCDSGLIDAIWIATPNALHAEHAIAAAERGIHVIVEKPMALTLEEADRMIAAADRSGIELMIGHSQVSSPPIRAMREVIASGRIGRVIQINTWHFNDWLQRPRVADELDTRSGGGILFRQAPHQADIVRYLGGGLLASVHAAAGRADPNFGTEGHYTAFAKFADGTPATMVYNGYGYFDIAELTWGIGEVPKPARDDGVRKPRVTTAVDARFKQDHPYVSDEMASREAEVPSFAGLTIVSCERGVLRQSPRGIFVYDESGCEEIPCNWREGREATALRELQRALAQRQPAFPDGRWGRATLEVCLAMLRSSAEGAEIRLTRQTAC